MTLRLPYLPFCQVILWLALLARSSAAKDAELLVDVELIQRGPQLPALVVQRRHFRCGRLSRVQDRGQQPGGRTAGLARTARILPEGVYSTTRTTIWSSV
jgi:hypothetical protein